MAISRRRFLGTSALGATAALTLPLARTARAMSPNNQVRIALVGLGTRGSEHLRGFGDSIVAICDADSKRVAAMKAGFKRPIVTETDFRHLLDRKDIDAVTIATPNHTHCWIAILAAQAGKHVYVEKPMSHDIWEGRQLVNAARHYDRIVQVGTQSRSSAGLQAAHEFIRAGKLGAIKFAVATCFKPRQGIGKLDKPLAIPASVDYDLWCGPAAKVDLFRPRLHYDWHWDFNTGNGDMGNQGVHQIDIARWFLGESAAAPRVISVGGRVGYSDAGDTPNTQLVYHAYSKAPLIVEVRGLPSSKAGQKRWGASMDSFRGSQIGVILQCEKGHMIIPSYFDATAYDQDGHKTQSWSGGGNHFKNFLTAVRSGKRTDLNAEAIEGQVSAALLHTGNISYQLGTGMPASAIRKELSATAEAATAFERMAAHLHANEIDLDHSAIRLGPWLEFDPVAERFPTNTAANAMVARECRKPFAIPEIKA